MHGGDRVRDSAIGRRSRAAMSARSRLHGLELRHALLEVVPVRHDHLGALLDEHLADVLGLLRVVVAAGVGDGGDASAHGAQGAAFAVLDGDALGRLHADLLHGEEVDGRVGLGGGRGQGAGGAEDVARWEVLVLPHLLDTRLDAAQRARADHGHLVLVLVALERLGGADARLRLLEQRGDDPVLLHAHVALALLVVEREAVLGLHAAHHAAEVLADEVDHQARAGVAVRDAVLGEDLVGQLRAGLEGQLLGEDERVVAVKQDLGELPASRKQGTW